MRHEYRGWIRLSNLPLEREDLWERLIARLELQRPDLGAVMGSTGPEFEVVMSTQAGSIAEAARHMVGALLEGIDASHVDAYPAGVEIERMEDEATGGPVPALRLVT